jgi:CPA1 family monovalent cation:H+ antiporter
MLDLHDDDPVGRELSTARDGALRAGLASLADDQSPAADIVRQEFAATLAPERSDGDAGEAMGSRHSELRRNAIDAARRAVLAMGANDEIGDDAFHGIEEELDWLEMAGSRTEQ